MKITVVTKGAAKSGHTFCPNCSSLVMNCQWDSLSALHPAVESHFLISAWYRLYKSMSQDAIQTFWRLPATGKSPAWYGKLIYSTLS